MSYNEAKEAIITRQQALRELQRHGADEQAFFADVGDKATYEGVDVLGWLGY